jgi:hypothetical protein
MFKSERDEVIIPCEQRVTVWNGVVAITLFHTEIVIASDSFIVVLSFHGVE